MEFLTKVGEGKGVLNEEEEVNEAVSMDIFYHW